MLRLALLAGTAAALCAVAPAWAQPGPGPAAASPPAAASDEALSAADGLTPDSFYLEADRIAADDRGKTVTATGHVEARYRGRTLRAQTLTYDQASGVVTARGDVVIVNPDGTAEFSKEVELDDQFRTGVALGFSARLQDNIKIAADSAIKRSDDEAELNRAIYTPCNICTSTGKNKRPTWSIQADKVVQDKLHHVIYYRNAVIRILGVPVFYTPVFWHPDAGAKARSGFLTPRLEISHKRGVSYEQPYVFAISPSQDLVVSPIFNTEVNPFLNLEWRKRFSNGQIDARFGYTYAREFDFQGDAIPGSDLTSRSYVLASGAFDMGDVWKWGFAAERVSDPLLFDRYDINGVYERRGLFETDSRRLLSQIYAVRQDSNSYLSISALDFQGLRIGDVNAAMPVVAPLIEGRWEPEGGVLGGRLRLTGSAVVLERKADLADPALPGVDNRRATSQLDWRRAFTLKDGVRIEPFASGRVDVYNIADQPPDYAAHTVGRALGSAGLDLSYPLIRTSGTTTWILEPLAEAVISPEANPNPDIPNTDSADFVFDETNLFDPNRAPGFDVYDSGVRVNLGGRATVHWGAGRQARFFVGRSFRQARDLNLPLTSGYSDRGSDWILAASAAPVRGLTLYGRTQLDGDTLSLRREELGANFMLSRVQGYVRYLHDYTDLTAGERENVEVAGDVFITKHWGIVAYAARDIRNDIWARRDIGVVYQDECARIEVVYHHSDAFVRLGGPSNSVQVRLTLATLGEQGYRSQDRR
jgi:LPS-assembly protein